MDSMGGSVEYCHQLYKLRDLVTVLPYVWSHSAERAGYGTLSQHVTMFPRLKEIRGDLGGYLHNFENAIYVLKNLSNLEAICINSDINQQDHAEQYLLEAPQEERDLLLQRLANLKQLETTSSNGFSVDSMNFAHKYLVGLESAKLEAPGSEDWIEKQQKEFCNTLLKLVLSTKKESSVEVKGIPTDILHTCFDSILETVFTDNPTKSVLTLRIEPSEFEDLQGFDVLKTNKERTVKVCEDELPSSVIKSNSRLNLVEVFKLEIAHLMRYPDDISLSTYSTLLQGMTALQELILDVPTAYDDYVDSNSFETKYMHVKSLTLQTTPRASYQSLLDQCCSTFPNLNYLKLFYSCGLWNEGAGNFQINLKDYTLDKLVVDMTALKAKQKASMQHFFVLDMGGQHMYQVPFNLCSFTKNKYDDLEGFTSGEGYLTVEICIRRSQRPELLMYCGIDKEEYEGEIDGEDDEHDLYLNYEHLITRLLIPILN